MLIKKLSKNRKHLSLEILDAINISTRRENYAVMGEKGIHSFHYRENKAIDEAEKNGSNIIINLRE